jgi:hypothetical protein
VVHNEITLLYSDSLHAASCSTSCNYCSIQRHPTCCILQYIMYSLIFTATSYMLHPAVHHVITALTATAYMLHPAVHHVITVLYSDSLHAASCSTQAASVFLPDILLYTKNLNVIFYNFSAISSPSHHHHHHRCHVRSVLLRLQPLSAKCFSPIPARPALNNFTGFGVT